ncbi:MAG: hypothetical protein BWY63_01626 [Chloroflexi bacterium ADurb.Bin360]|nr:MAG: hypothetical protein BWY63_01626 [Chloroflexi bacterium ADurb.Bin360]
MRNFARINNYFNVIQAWEDWKRIAAQHPEIAEKFEPPSCAGWRRIDLAIERVRNAVEEANNDGLESQQN